MRYRLSETAALLLLLLAALALAALGGISPVAAGFSASQVDLPMLTVTRPPPPLEVTNVQATPNPFNLSGSTTVNFNLSRAANAAALVLFKVYTASYVEQVRVVGPVPKPQGPGSFVWDGRNQTGQVVSSGLYVAAVVAAAEYPVYSYTLVVADNGVAPNISGLNANPSVIIPPGITWVSYDLSKGAAELLLILNPSGGEVRRVGPYYHTPGRVANWWDAKDNSGSYVPNGYYVALSLAIDFLGRTGWGATLVHVGSLPSGLQPPNAEKVASAWLEKHRGQFGGFIKTTLEAIKGSLPKG